MKNTIKSMGILLCALPLFFVSCGDDDDPVVDLNSQLELNIDGLENLGSDYTYEGWLIVDGNAVTTGLFSVNDSGEMSSTSFEVLTSDLESASTFVLTVEPSPDSDPAPSKVHILAGDFSGNGADLSIDHSAALNNDFSSAEGKYILATPTDDLDTNEDSGIWFLDNSTGSPEVGLNLPSLPEGWAYEGWAVIDGTPVSTGTFTEFNVADDLAPFSGSLNGPPFPGEDFLINAPGSLSFPTSLAGGTAVISIEPVPDNSVAPFVLKPLVGMIPENAAVHTAYDIGQNLNFPTGRANR